MKITPFILVAASSLLFAQPATDEPIEALVKKLGSNSAKERETATKMLLARPESEAALRRAVLSKDVEVARRAQYVLDHFDLKKLDDAVAEGRVERLIEIVNSFPEGRHEDAIWAALSKFGQRVIDLHRKDSIVPEKLDLQWTQRPVALTCELFTESTPGPIDCRYLVRAGAVDHDRARAPKAKARNELTFSAPVIVCNGAVRHRADIIGGAFILARGPVEIDGPIRSLIVCAGDVTIKGGITGNSLVIARGKVTCNGRPFGSRFISGAAVIIDEKKKNGNPITENENRPFGYIRWEAPKETGKKK